MFYIAYWVALHTAGKPVLGLLVAAAFVVVPGTLLTAARYTEAGRSLMRLWTTTEVAGAITAMLVLIAFSTAGFTALSFFLHQHGLGAFPGRGAQTNTVIATTYENFLFNAAESIPVLEVPDTVDWSAPREMKGHVQGVLVLIYKIFILVPMVFVAKEVYDHIKAEKEEDSPLAT